MRNWKTTTAGIVTAAFGFVVFSPDLFAGHAWIVAVAKYATIGGLASMGIAGKDHEGPQ
jgi:hypothetical protein